MECENIGHDVLTYDGEAPIALTNLNENNFEIFVSRKLCLIRLFPELKPRFTNPYSV